MTTHKKKCVCGHLLDVEEVYQQGRADALDIDMDKPMHFTPEQKAWVKKYISINGERQRADGAREFAELLKKKFNEFIDYDDNGEQTFESNPDLVWIAIDEALADWQKKGKENE